MTRAFAENPDVVFGDVNLASDKIRGHHNPGAGGWPTVRYFNAETGVEGAPYEKKTSKHMCDELGPKETYLEEFIEEKAKTSLCGLDGKNCDERSLKYLEKQKGNDLDTWKKQLERLLGLEESGDLGEENLSWVKKRAKILRNLISADGKEEL